jgi:hypothetical protein
MVVRRWDATRRYRADKHVIARRTAVFKLEGVCLLKDYYLESA